MMWRSRRASLSPAKRKRKASRRFASGWPWTPWSRLPAAFEILLPRFLLRKSAPSSSRSSSSGSSWSRVRTTCSTSSSSGRRTLSYTTSRSSPHRSSRPWSASRMWSTATGPPSRTTSSAPPATPLPPSGARTASRRTPSVASTATSTSTCAHPASRYPKRSRAQCRASVRSRLGHRRPSSRGWMRCGDLPIVYITLGTVYNHNLDVFRALLDGLRDEALNIVVTVGKQNDPADARSAAVERPRAPVHPARATAPSLRRCRDARWRRLNPWCTRIRPAAPRRPPRRRSVLQRRPRRCRRRRSPAHA